VRSVSADGKRAYRQGTDYPLQKVKYVQRVLPLDGFLSFNGYIYGRPVSKGYIARYQQNRRKVPLSKYRKWSHEREYRLVDETDWFTTRITEAGPIERWRIDRIFRYDQTQLTGVIFGMKMPEQDRSEVFHTIAEMRNRLRMDTGGCLPVVQFSEAVQVHSRYQMRIVPIKGLDCCNAQFEPQELTSKLEEMGRMTEIGRRTAQGTEREYALYRGKDTEPSNKSFGARLNLEKGDELQ
jgi:hypothetical protein